MSWSFPPVFHVTAATVHRNPSHLMLLKFRKETGEFCRVTGLENVPRASVTWNNRNTTRQVKIVNYFHHNKIFYMVAVKVVCCSADVYPRENLEDFQSVNSHKFPQFNLILSQLKGKVRKVKLSL
jgi:hypothetical protein